MITGSNTYGMGNVVLPGDPGKITDFSTQKIGSGDFINNKENKIYKQKPKYILLFDDFFKEYLKKYKNNFNI